MKVRTIGYAAFVAVTAAAFVIGSGGPSEAKHKKKMAAPPPQQRAVMCFPGGAPVCGMKGGMKFTYGNACYAQLDGAKVTAAKACAAPKAAKAHKRGMKGKKKA